ncbi:MAG: TonB-dependent receptor [Bacteroidetes bacterium GWF2_33_16]|nr:MAG: TonB-dependent receptor [Bacteroidetes bacterium GWE2_32_14]OFY04119.1 MAG: TonB-dependent receptor [Bacteroidetes bacterium GWF2_33_16]
MKIFRRKFLILALMLVSFASFSQSKVKGILVDAQNGEVLIGASIVVEGTTIGAATSLNGSFTLDVPSGSQKLVFSYVGYLEKSWDVNLQQGEEIDLGAIGLEPNSIGLEEIRIVSSFARDRETPVAISTIKPEVILEKLGTQEYPEILKSTPSVYATKGGGGYGDSRIYLRGFDSNNIGVLINGVPVNGQENGKVYWSNWAGLSDVTQIMQVQRGLGASKLAISSVGGTINILTKTTDVKTGGNIYYGIGNDGYTKQAFTLSTGLLENGWAITLSGAHTFGDGYVKGTNFEGWSYFLNVSKRINDNQSLSFTAFGAPQWHNQRNLMHTIEEYRNHPDGIKFNSDYGYRDGEIYNTAYAYNYYHKPQLSLNHYWTINEKSNLSTAAYASISKGGGRRTHGNSSLVSKDFNTGLPYATTLMTPEGYIDWEAAIARNENRVNGSEVIIANGINEHDWYGVVSTLNTELFGVEVTGGIDGRWYRGYHAYEIDDLLGGDYYLNNNDQNRAVGTPLYKGDYISYYYLSDLAWVGLFLQGEYKTEKYSAFISGSLSDQLYRRTDYFLLPEDQTTDWYSFIDWSAKGGANYNINKNHNVFVNGGYFTRAPYFESVFIGRSNDFNDEAVHEKILSTEVGYGYRSKMINADLTLYRTVWMDKTLQRSLGNNVTANLMGLDATHMGVEFTSTIKPLEKLDINAMVSVGDWKWNADVNATIVEDDGSSQTIVIDLTNVHVGNSAQTTAAIGIDYEVLPKFKIGADYNYYDNLFADFDITSRTESIDSWEMPNYSLIDINARYSFKIGKVDATLIGNINNLLDTEYIADAKDGSNHDAGTALVYFGFGRTYSLSFKINF